MSLRIPIAVRLPRHRVLGRLDLAGALAHAAGDVRKRPTGRQLSWFALTPRERRFARELLARHPNLWLYRTHQQRRVGDFAVVDMSAPAATGRPVWVLDLKLGAPIRVGGGGAGIQLANAGAAVRYLQGEGVLGHRAPVVLLTGDGPTLIARWWGLGG